MPSDWKSAQVSAIFKKGDKSRAGNYRPVSLTCISCKVMETIVREYTINHMKANNLFSNKQYGFINGRSTGLQLLKILDIWTEILDEGGDLDVIYLDFMKAFDSVPHNRLLYKLERYGIQGNIVGWIKDFLIGRKQRVGVKGCYSEWTQVLSGIPQGSVLGPLLFVIYINDLSENISSELFMFADDTKVFRKMGTDEDHSKLQKDITTLEKWSKLWLLKFHPDKCKVMNVTRNKDTTNRKYTMSDNTSEEKITLSHTILEKDLGLNIDPHLKFEKHLNEKVNKANKIMGLIRRSFTHLNIKTFCQLYKTIVRNPLEYAIATWCPEKLKILIN